MRPQEGLFSLTSCGFLLCRLGANANLSREAPVVETWRDIQKISGLLTYTFGPTNLSLMDFWVKPKRGRSNRKKEEVPVEVVSE